MEAILASSAFPKIAYRPGFNIPLLFPNPFPPQDKTHTAVGSHHRPDPEEEWFRGQKFLAVSPQPLPELEESDGVGLESAILILDFCPGPPANYWERCRTSGKKNRRSFPYPQVLQVSYKYLRF